MLNRRIFLSIYALGLMVVMSALVSCNKSGVQAPDTQAHRAEVAPTPLHHWLQHAEILSLMKRIEEDRQKMVETVAVGDGATLHPDAHRDYLAASEAAKRLALSVKEIGAAAADVPMTDEDRKAFDEATDAMRLEARKFSIMARKRRLEVLEERMQALEATCISCHTRFRDVAAEWQPPRV